MSILNRLSSARGDRTEAWNMAVAADVLSRPELLDEIAVGLQRSDRKLPADCVEVFTAVAKTEPALVASYAEPLIPLLRHRDTRVRWEATHALALVAALVPAQIEPLLPDLAAKIERDRSVIVREAPSLPWANLDAAGPTQHGKHSPF